MAGSPFIGADDEPLLVPCAVLFFDFLGVGAMAQGDRAKKELLRFNETIRDALPYPIGTAALRQGDSAYPAAVFSDSVVAAVPAEAELHPAGAVFQLTFEVARLQTDLALRDYFARGALTFDQFHFHDGLIFGPALVEAVGIESTAAIDPRVVLSPAATEILRDALRASSDDAGIYLEPPVLVDEDRLAFVDYLGGAVNADPGLDLRRTLERHRKAVEEQLSQTKANLSRWSKHRWVAEYHNATVERFTGVLAERGGHESLFVSSVRTKRRFEPLLQPR